MSFRDVRLSQNNRTPVAQQHAWQRPPPPPQISSSLLHHSSEEEDDDEEPCYRGVNGTSSTPKTTIIRASTPPMPKLSKLGTSSVSSSSTTTATSASTDVGAVVAAATTRTPAPAPAPTSPTSTSSGSSTSRRSYALHGKVHYYDDDTTSSAEEKKSEYDDGSNSILSSSRRRRSSTGSSSLSEFNSIRQVIQRRSQFSQLVNETQQFQKLVSDLEKTLEGYKEGDSPEASWRARIMIRSAKDQDNDLQNKLYEYEKTLTMMAAEKGENQQEVRNAQSACLKVHRDFKRVHKSLLMALSLYEKRQHAEVSLLGSVNAVGWSQAATAAHQEKEEQHAVGNNMRRQSQTQQLLSPPVEKEDFYERAMKQAEIEKINQKMNKVNDLYRDLASIVEQQQQNVNIVQEEVVEVKYEVERAAEHITCAHQRENFCGTCPLEDVQVRLHDDDDPFHSNRYCGGYYQQQQQQLQLCGVEKLPTVVPKRLAAQLPVIDTSPLVAPFVGAYDTLTAPTIDEDDRSVAILAQEDAVEIECSENFELKKDPPPVPDFFEEFLPEICATSPAIDNVRRSLVIIHKEMMELGKSVLSSSKSHDGDGDDSQSPPSHQNWKDFGQSMVNDIMNMPCDIMNMPTADNVNNTNSSNKTKLSTPPFERPRRHLQHFDY